MVQVVKLRKIGKKPLKIFAKIVFSKLIKSPRRKIFETFLHGQKGHLVADLFLNFELSRRIRLGEK